MTDPAAFKATLVDFKNIRTRKLVQIVFEAPIETADRILAGLGGYGTLGKESWWAVARMDGEPAPASPKPEKERRKWDELSYAEQAGIRCNEPSFWRFVSPDGDCQTNIEAAMHVRGICRVKSRAELNIDHDARYRWEMMERRYQTWLREAEVVETVEMTK